MSIAIPFDNTYARLPNRFYSKLRPTPVAEPRIFAVNEALANDLNVDLTGMDPAKVFSGNALPDNADPLAQAYAGHQFGGWNPQLGDGRAILLGEVIGRDGVRRDVQLKGSGPTPYSRNGDGRAWLGPVLREYVVSEAMHAMGIPTTRALAAVTTGQPVIRERPLPGSVLTRVAQSHIRVGTFQFFAARQDTDALRDLTGYVIQRHYPDAETPLDLLKQVAARQAELIAKWMGVGFIHGVMNTDNCQIAGETIDYGPCAFMDDYHPMQVFSSIDHYGRYAYAKQPDIAAWNLAQFATALLPLMPDRDAAIEDFTEAVNGFAPIFAEHWQTLFLQKIGITNMQDGDVQMIHDLLDLMTQQEADFTNTFRGLITDTATEQFAEPNPFEAWAKLWRDRIKSEPDPEKVMRLANPAIIPRNHRTEDMIQAAIQGDKAPFDRLMNALATPFDDTDHNLTKPPKPDQVVTQTFCGT
ncbi:protein adenylyltransferase SelO [Parasulfitobacter algicola]|uniref:Protein nucleotidyltransferase YdiU n=1 Tax=Parasulfitobacter algicola TaxID=2614809 RepID=A0ABX2IWG1_9RHOB|nr:YdiU family protein [Sulfitobacter algicola]NSX56381.1 YdiU family protein [Sulfitobacter algicola]